jgi:hypothetical protein
VDGGLRRAAVRHLADGGLRAAEGTGHLRDRQAEHLAQDEHGALDGGEGLEHHQERQRDLLTQFGRFPRIGCRRRARPVVTCTRQARGSATSSRVSADQRSQASCTVSSASATLPSSW